MTQEEFIAELFCRVDDAVPDLFWDPRAKLCPGELVTLGILFILYGRSQRRFYGWLSANWRSLFPQLPERTRLFRLLAQHRDWADRFLAEPTLLGFSDSLGIDLGSELIHPRREGRSAQQIGKKGVSNGRWIVGVKFCALLNGQGRIVDWDAEAANVHDSAFQRMLGDWPAPGKLADQGFHRSARRGGDCAGLVICERGQRNFRMVIETLFSGLVRVFGMKKIAERAWLSIEARLAFACAAWNLVTDWATELFGGQNASLSTAWIPL